MGQVVVLEETTVKPISLMGQMAGLCYGSDTIDEEKNYKRGLNCLKSEHGRVLEYPTINLFIDGYSARCIRELYTHIAGAPTRLQQSTRYVDYSNFEYVMPKSIEKIYGASLAVDNYIQSTRELISSLEKNYNIPREDLGMLLPLGMKTSVVVKYNARTLSTMAEQRLCIRAYWEYQDLMKNIKKSLQDYSEEWNTLGNFIFKPKCEKLHYCPEVNGCGLSLIHI